MSVDIKFNKSLTLNMLREFTDFSFEYYSDTDLWVASKSYGDEEQFIQLLFNRASNFDFGSYNEMSTREKLDYVKKYNRNRNSIDVGTFESDGDIPIYEFTIRGRGMLMIRDISKIFQCKFMTDAEYDEIFYMSDEFDEWDDNKWNEWYEETYRVVMDSFGLVIDENGIIIDKV